MSCQTPYVHKILKIFHNLKKIELVNIATLRKWCVESPLSNLEVLTVENCSELTELPSPHMFPFLQQIYISECEELVTIPQIPWTSSVSQAKLQSVGKSIQYLDYSKKEQEMSVEFKKDAIGHEPWNVLAFSNLSEIKEFSISECSPVPLDYLQLLNSQKILHLRICDCVATAKQLAELISYFPNLSTLGLWSCDIKQAGGAEETEAAAGGHVSMPLELMESLQNLSSLKSLLINDCPILLPSSSLPSFYCPFPTSLQSLSLFEVKDAMLTLAPLTNLTELVLDDCKGLRSEDLWHLLAQGLLKELTICGVPNLLNVPEPSRMCGQDLPQHSSRLQALETDGEGGPVAVPIGGHFFSSLTELSLDGNYYMEHFTKEQSEALQMLTSLQLLYIRNHCSLQSLPEGLSGLSNLKKLQISNCGGIRSLPKDGLPSSLVELRIEFCRAIRSLPKGTLPSSLTKLQIYDCRAFRSLPKERLPSSLKILWICYCPAFRSLHEGSLPSSLQMLDVTSSSKKLQRQCQKLQGRIPIVKLGD